ncbi:MAG: YciI family protein [Pseudomonadota bacterium]
MLKTFTLALAFAAAATAFAAETPAASGSDYLLIVQESNADFATRNDPAKAGAYWASFKAYGDELGKAGVIRGGNVILPPTVAKTITAKGASVGPSDQAKLQQGGYFVIHTATETEALDWAAKCPALKTGGAVEVRAIIPQNM